MFRKFYRTFTGFDFYNENSIHLVKNKTCHVYDLPDEILTHLFWNFKNQNSLALVSKRFNRIYKEIQKQKLNQLQKTDCDNKLTAALLGAANAYQQHDFGFFKFFKAREKLIARAIIEIIESIQHNDRPINRLIMMSVAMIAVSFVYSNNVPSPFVKYCFLPFLIKLKLIENTSTSINENIMNFQYLMMNGCFSESLALNPQDKRKLTQVLYLCFFDDRYLDQFVKILKSANENIFECLKTIHQKILADEANKKQGFPDEEFVLYTKQFRTG